MNCWEKKGISVSKALWKAKGSLMEAQATISSPEPLQVFQWEYKY